jgi:hypothetical protein
MEGVAVMLCSEIVRRVRQSIGDLAVLQVEKQTLTDWINDAVRECVISNSLLQARGVSETVAEQDTYVLPSDIFKIYSVLVDNIKIQLLTLQEWEEYFSGVDSPSSTRGFVPTHAYSFAGALTLWPTPAEVKPLVINYSKMPTTITYSSEPEAWSPNSPPIPAAYHNRIVTYCLAQVAMQDDDVEKYAALMQMFATGVVDLNHIKDPEDSLYPFMSVSDRDAE